MTSDHNNDPESASGASPYPRDALEFRFVHASGPGGQHVNKASTAVELRVTIRALMLANDVAHRLATQQKNRINKQGELVIQADQFRSQLKNRKDALARLSQMIAAARVRPKRRVATRPSRTAKGKRMDTKTQRGRTKRNRQKPTSDS
jgi:ribosome-associated protein